MFVFMLRLDWESCHADKGLSSPVSGHDCGIYGVSFIHAAISRSSEVRTISDVLHLYTSCWKKMCISSCYPLSIALVVLDSAILFTHACWLFLQEAGIYLLFILITMCFFASFLNMVTIFMQSFKQIMVMRKLQFCQKMGFLFNRL